MTERDAVSENHDCGDVAAAYALGALEPAEADAFRQHLKQCTICRNELEALEGVVQALPMAAPQVEPPRRLRRRVLRAVRNEPRAAVAASRRSRSVFRIPRPALAALGAAVLAIGAVVAGLELSGGNASPRVIQAQVSGISGSAQLRLSDGHGELVVRNLTPPPPGHVYEVWLRAPGGTPVPASVLFSVNSGGGADVGIPAQLRGIGEVMVTPEPKGGSPKPTHAPVIVASLT